MLIGLIPYLIIVSYSILLRRSKSILYLGRLSVVYNTAGKARVIAITNWWIQLCLKPLHDNLFKVLQQEPTDGTFDQDKPLDILLSKDLPGKISSFDLSAATDRLPIDLQQDILNHLFGDNVGSL